MDAPSTQDIGRRLAAINVTIAQIEAGPEDYTAERLREAAALIGAEIRAICEDLAFTGQTTAAIAGAAHADETPLIAPSDSLGG